MLFIILIAVYVCIGVYLDHPISLGSDGFKLYDSVLCIIIALIISKIINNILIEKFYEKQIKRSVPHLIKNLISLVIYFISILFIISLVSNDSESTFTRILGATSVLSLVIGFALRNMIFDFFSGIAVNIDSPYKIGDYVKIHQKGPNKDLVGSIMDINWRSTKILTEPNNVIIIPNSLMSTFVVTNFWAPNSISRFEDFFALDFSVPTDRAKRVIKGGLFAATKDNGFVVERAPEVLINKTNDYGIEYKVRYWINAWDGMKPPLAKDLIHNSILSHINNAGLSLAYPKEDIFYEKMPTRHLDSKTKADAYKIIRSIELFKFLSDEQIQMVVKDMIVREFESSERLIVQDEKGDSMFVLVEGLLRVTVLTGKNGTRKESEVAVIKPGDFFGEMSLLTGESRSASIESVTDSIVYEIRKDSFKPILSDNKELAEQLSQIIAKRNLDKENVKNMSAADMEENQKNIAAQILSGIKSFFADVFA